MSAWQIAAAVYSVAAVAIGGGCWWASAGYTAPFQFCDDRAMRHAVGVVVALIWPAVVVLAILYLVRGRKRRA